MSAYDRSIQSPGPAHEGNIPISVPGIIGAITISREYFPPSLRGVEGMEKKLQEKITAGGSLLKRIAETSTEQVNQWLTLSREEKTHHISDIAFYLQARAEGKLSMRLSSGSFSLADPHGTLVKFMTSHPGSRRRKSAHLQAIQNSGKSEDAANPGTEHYAIDFRDTLDRFDTCLPYAMTGILFGRIPKEALSLPGQRPIVEDRLYFKMEKSHRGLDVLAPLWRKCFGRGDPAGTFEAVPPANVKADYRRIIRNCGKNKLMKALLKSGNYENPSQGYRVMVANLENLRAVFAKDIAQSAKLQSALNHFAQAYQAHLYPHFDHPHLRFGHEVILNVTELSWP